jgi:surfactin synthase thioesterase subunit
MLSHSPANWIRCFAPRPAASLRLLCFPHAGGSSSAYFHLARRFPQTVEVCAVQYPGRENRITEPLLRDIALALDEIERAVSTLKDKPLALFGHSMGGILAFEAALRLEAAGLRPAHLFISSCPPPDIVAAATHRTDDDALLAALTDLGGTSPEILKESELLALILPPLRADYEMLDSYTRSSAAVVHCPITTIGGRDDLSVSLVQMQPWKSLTRSSFASWLLPGDHFYLAKYPDELAGVVLGRLRQNDL